MYLIVIRRELMVGVTDSSQEVKKRLKTAAETCDEQTSPLHPFDEKTPPLHALDEQTPPLHALVGSCVPPAESCRGKRLRTRQHNHFACMGSNSALCEDSKLDKLPRGSALPCPAPQTCMKARTLLRHCLVTGHSAFYFSCKTIVSLSDLYLRAA